MKRCEACDKVTDDFSSYGRCPECTDKLLEQMGKEKHDKKFFPPEFNQAYRP